MCKKSPVKKKTAFDLTTTSETAVNVGSARSLLCEEGCSTYDVIYVIDVRFSFAITVRDILVNFHGLWMPMTIIKYAFSFPCYVAALPYSGRRAKLKCQPRTRWYKTESNRWLFFFSFFYKTCVIRPPSVAPDSIENGLANWWKIIKRPPTRNL